MIGALLGWSSWTRESNVEHVDNNNTASITGPQSSRLEIKCEKLRQFFDKEQPSSDGDTLRHGQGPTLPRHGSS